MAGKTKPGIPVKGINIKLKMINDLIDVTGSAKDSWNPAEISDDMKAIAYIHDLADTWNPAQLNEALKYLGFATIDSWNPAIIEETKNKLVKYFLPTDASGNPIELDLKGSLPYEVTSLTVDLLPIQDLSQGEPSPTNICPISGRTEVNLFRYNNDLFKPLYVETISKIRCTLSVSNNVYTMVGTGDDASIGYYPSVGSSYQASNGTKQPCTAGDTIYILISDIRLSKNFVVFYNNNNEVISRSSISGQSFTVPSNATYYTLRIGAQNSNGVTYNFTVKTYNERTVKEITLPQTVYGGNSNVVEGGTDSTYGIVDLGDLSWTYSGNGVFYSNDISSVVKRPASNNDKVNGYCECYSIQTRTDITGQTVDSAIGCSNVGLLLVRDTRYTDATAFATAITGQHFCYELATPTELTTSAEQISLLNGQNVISTDGDTINITYKANLNS